ncbi:hypothetical protein [Longibacter salinarum]|uniref:hypothetical protein n=1 Tax=Longibacter salinarum TaxID=1850348 RepID=UPI001180FC26|nr:hypothetical protein [Longibacter salinarum]
MYTRQTRTNAIQALSPRIAWLLLVGVCVLTRVATTITYIEDPDSLRFALSVANEYDVAAMQPHFPGYPVFWAVVKPLYVVLGSFSTAFSVVGGLATAGIIAALLFLWKKPLVSTEGAIVAAIVAFNPLIWLMGNRYMPDLLGTACAMAAFALLLRSLTSDDGVNRGLALFGVILTGWLAGLRLSYLPLLSIPVLVVLWRLFAARQMATLGRIILAGVVSVAVWLIPMIIDTGWSELVQVASAQTTGHFTEFGGTVQTESDMGRRIVRFVRGVWADGLGAWWPGRHPLTLAVSAGALGLGALGLRQLLRENVWHRTDVWVGAAGMLAYAVWVFFFQNVIHKSRHILPLLPMVLWLTSMGATVLWNAARQQRLSRAAVSLTLIAYAAVSLVLVWQHRSPTAIAQVKAFVEREEATGRPLRVISDPLVNTYLDAQDIDARYISVVDTAAVRRAMTADSGASIVVGTYPGLVDQPESRTRTFYHNPFVNRMWSDITVRMYESHRRSHDATQHANDE